MEVRPGYKQTEVGVIPEDWAAPRLDSLGSGSIPAIKAGPFGSSLTKDQYVVEGFKVYGQEQVIRGDYLFGDYFISAHKYRELESCAVRPGDVLLSLVGTTGKLLEVPDDAPPGIINPRLLRFSFDRSKVLPKFFKYQFESDSVQSQLSRQAQGGTMGVLNASALRPFQIPLPPFPEQRAIAVALSDVDALLGGLERLIAKKRDLKQAAMQQLLTGQARLPGFSGEWEVKRLGEVASFYKGKGLPKSAISSFGAEPCIHYGELFTRYQETISEIISRTDTSGGTFRSVANDVLMPTSDVTPRGLAKASCVRADGVILGGDILVIRSDTKLIFGSFLSYLIRYEEEQVLQLVTGSTVFHLYGSDMKKFTFSMPPLPEQTAIAAVLADMDAELSLLTARRDKTRDLKQAMMQELLTGRIRLV